MLSAVTVHSGQTARVRYRADDTAGGSLTVGLLVTTRDGTVRRRLVAGKVVQAGAEQVWRGRIRLRPGRYLLVARATDASGPSRDERHAGGPARTALPAAARADRACPARSLRLGLTPRRRRRRRGGRQSRQCLRVQRAALLHHRQHRQGHAAGRVPPPAPHGLRRHARHAHAHDHGLGQRGRRRGLRERRPRRAQASRAARAHDELPRLCRVDPLPRRRRRHGAVLPGHGAVRPARPPQVRAQAALVHRPVPVVGHPGRGPAARLPRVLQGRLAGQLDARERGRAPGARPRTRRASPSSPTTTPPATTARRPSPASPPACSGADQADITPAPLSGGGHPPAPALRRRGRGVRCARRAVRGPRWPRSGRLRSRSRCRASSARSARAPRA